jgi:hypothetical protein
MTPVHHQNPASLRVSLTALMPKQADSRVAVT